jgi:hypothetical protein
MEREWFGTFPEHVGTDWNDPENGRYPNDW